MYESKEQITEDQDKVFVSELSLCKTCLKLILYAVFLVLILSITIIPFFFEYFFLKGKNSIRTEQLSSNMKYILLWEDDNTEEIRIPDFQEGKTMFEQQNCNFDNCFITMNKSLLNDNEKYFDAIVFDVRDVVNKDSPLSYLERSKDQIYIFRSMEPSDYYPVCDPRFEDFFNWTWTYKLDSDIPAPFFEIFDKYNKSIGPKHDMIWTKRKVREIDYRNVISNKSKAVAWVISKCRTKNKHAMYFKELDDLVDMYGACTQQRCSNGNILKCYEMVEQTYFFQVIVESSMAEDFVTERIIKPFHYLAIPILYGDSDYSRFLPPGSYINAKGLRPEILSEIIDNTIKNSQMYAKFFSWKAEYFYRPRLRFNVCDLCAKLNSNHQTKPRRNFRTWWNPSYHDFCANQDLYQKLTLSRI